jgi:hypothetical protein
MSDSDTTPRLERLAFPPAAEHLEVTLLLKQARDQGTVARFHDLLGVFQGDDESAALALWELEEWGFIVPSDGQTYTGENYLEEPVVFTAAGAALLEQIAVHYDEEGQRYVSFAGSDGTAYTLVTSADRSLSASFSASFSPRLIDEPGRN